MRVLLVDDSAVGSKEVLEIVDMGYDDDITDVKEYSTDCVAGLYMVDTSGDFLYIVGMPLAVCNTILETMLQTGYCDLSNFGQYTPYEEFVDLEERNKQ